MKIEQVSFFRVALPLVTPFRTAFGSMAERDILLVHVQCAEAEGWGECVALSEPVYSPEWVDGAQEVLRRWIVPALFGVGDLAAEQVAGHLAFLKGHQMAKGAVELAILDAELRNAGQSLSAHLGGTRARVDVGVSVGIADSTAELLRVVAGYVADGYRRVKLKIEPGWDLEPVAAVRDELDPSVALQVDGNTAYGASDVDHLRRLDEHGLLLIEQPFPADDLTTHVALASAMDTPICLDESIDSLRRAVDAIEMGACSVINIKAGRVGGFLEARRIHDFCFSRGVAVWCGGMLETGIGRAANLALASLPGFTLPGDISASDRYYQRDITDPFVLDGGCIAVPTGPGIGTRPHAELLEHVTTSVERLTPSSCRQ